MRNPTPLLLTIAGLALITTIAAAQSITQPPYTKQQLLAFHGDQNSLVNVIRDLEKATGGRVLEVRFTDKTGSPGFRAAVAKGDRVEFIHMDQRSRSVADIAEADMPVWMLKWRDRESVHLGENAKVSLAQAINTAEGAQNGAPAVAAGLARSATAPNTRVHAYNVLLDNAGNIQRVAVDNATGEVIADPGALSDLR